MGSQTFRHSAAVVIAMTVVAIVLSVNVADGGIVKYTKLWLEQIEHTFMDTPGSNQPQPYTAPVVEVPRSDTTADDDSRPSSGYNPLLMAKGSGGAFVPSKSSDEGTKKKPAAPKGKNNADENVLMCVMRPNKKKAESGKAGSEDEDDGDRSTVTGGAKALDIKQK